MEKRNATPETLKPAIREERNEFISFRSSRIAGLLFFLNNWVVGKLTDDQIICKVWNCVS